MKMPSTMTHRFSEVPQANIPRSVFDRSHSHKTTFNASYLIPFYVDEALPGDTFNVDATLFARLATPIVPIMDNLYLDTFYFAVPFRLVWEHFQNFMGEEEQPGVPVEYLIPQLNDSALDLGFPTGSLADYFGMPIDITPISVSALFHRAYKLIWNEWFRDENLQTKATLSLGDGPDLDAQIEPRQRGKRHDYFTSALPWPQKGPGVELPLGESAPVITDGLQLRVSEDALGTDPRLLSFGATANVKYSGADQADPMFYADQGLVADLSNATAATINSLRQAFQIQKLFERDARGGTRYTEVVRSHFGVVSPDARLQRPEFLGGKSTPVVITPVQQTSSTDGQSPQGNLAAFGTVASLREGFTKSFTEHTIVMGICMVRSDLTYQQGLPRMFSRSTRFDFYWPALAHLGEQAVLNKEIFFQGAPDSGDNEDVFGYQERWSEYRYFPSKITGLLRSDASGSIDVWHLAQDFGALPFLGDDFIVENPPIDRIVAVTGEPHFIFDSFIKIKAVRPMPTYSVPGLIDHF